MTELVLSQDFSSFYSSSLADQQGKNPYELQRSDYLPNPDILNLNLNPPFFLDIIIPFAWISFPYAYFLWFILSLTAGALGTFYLARILGLQRQNILLLLLYFAFYPSIVNMSTAQLGGFLFFFIIAGFYYYQKKCDTLTALLWGFIISIKIFPALLFFFVLIQKRYKLFCLMGLICALLASIPLITHGKEIYFKYLEMINHVSWYGTNWNGSFYGFIYRVFIDKLELQTNLLPVTLACLIVFIFSLGYYIKIQYQQRNNADDLPSFLLTVAMMLWLSPFGWLYYFSVLILPLIMIWQILDKTSPTNKGLYLLCLFLINFPYPTTLATKMNNLFLKLTLYSSHFYGLSILIFLIYSSKIPFSRLPNIRHDTLCFPILIIFCYGVVIQLGHYLLKLIL